MSPGLQLIVVLNPLAVDERAVAAIEIAERPLALRLKDFGVVAAAALVLHDDRVGRGPPDRHRLAVDQTEHVGPLRAFANNQVCRHRIVGVDNRISGRPVAPMPVRTLRRSQGTGQDLPNGDSPIGATICANAPIYNLFPPGVYVQVDSCRTANVAKVYGESRSAC